MVVRIPLRFCGGQITITERFMFANFEYQFVLSACGQSRINGQPRFHRRVTNGRPIIGARHQEPGDRATVRRCDGPPTHRAAKGQLEHNSLDCS